MKRSALTDKVKTLLLEGKNIGEISKELGITMSSTRNRANYLYRNDELEKPYSRLAAIREMSNGMPGFFVTYLTTSGLTVEEAEVAIALWNTQDGKCALTGHEFSSAPQWSPVLVNLHGVSAKLISQAINSLRGAFSIESFITLCTLVANHTQGESNETTV